MRSREPPADAVVMATRAQVTTAAATLTAAVVGLATWTLTMAAAPRYSYGRGDGYDASRCYYAVLLAAALIIGFVAPTRAGLLGAILGLPGLVLSPWTAPRGDNDGLWILIIPLLWLFVVALIATAQVGAWARSRFTHGDG